MSQFKEILQHLPGDTGIL